MSYQRLEQTIPAGERLLIDASPLIAYFEESEHVSGVAAHVIEQFVAEGRNSAIVSAVSVMEVLVRPLRAGPGERYHHVLDFLTRFPNLRIGVIDGAVAQEAAAVRATFGFPVPDALVIATGIVNQVGHLITNDGSWQRKLQPIARRIKVCYLADFV